MERYSRPPGPWISQVQSALLEAVLDGEIAAGDEKSAWDYLERHPELLEDG